MPTGLSLLLLPATTAAIMGILAAAAFAIIKP